MPLEAGSSIGPYDIVGLIGTGGMGEVYRARDRKLHREVAVKTLREPFATDAERLTRFEREARALAALNHPHIAQIYGVEESNGAHALVMELIPSREYSNASRIGRCYHTTRRRRSAGCCGDVSRRTCASACGISAMRAWSWRRRTAARPSRLRS